MLHLLLTFDYELYFNDCDYPEEEVLIQPTYDIADCLERHGVRGTFFVDVLSLDRYVHYGLDAFPKMVKKQVKDLLDRGHDIQLHIHPIWEKAEYDGDKWAFDNTFYSLSSFDNVEEIVHKAKRLLDGLADSHRNYECCAFRAGGFCMDPQERVMGSLLENGIRIDSSVCKGTWMDTMAQSFDYRNVPKEQNWHAIPKTGIFCAVSEERHSLFEIPVGTYGKIPEKWFLTHGMPTLSYPPLKGKRTPTLNSKRKSSVRKLVEKVHQSFAYPVLFTLDSLHSEALYRITSFYEECFRGVENNGYVCAIGHPKFFSKPCIDNMGVFIGRVQEKDNCDFITMKDVHATRKDVETW